MAWRPRELAHLDEPRGARITDEERRDREDEFIGQPGLQELGEHRCAALDHQPGHAADRQVVEHAAQIHAMTRVGDVCLAAQAIHGGGDGCRRHVDDPVRARREDLGGRVKVPGATDHHPGRIRISPAGDPFAPAGRRPDQQDRIVCAYRSGTDEDGVAASTELIDAVDVGVPGQAQRLVRGVVDVPVQRHRAAQQHIRPVHAGQPTVRRYARRVQADAATASVGRSVLLRRFCAAGVTEVTESCRRGHALTTSWLNPAAHH